MLSCKVFGILAACAGLCLAQTPPPAPAPKAPAAEVGKPPQAAPQNGPQEAPPIRVEVNEVIIPVTVTDERGRFVSDLDTNDFKIIDEHQEQKIAFFTRERSQPVVVGFLLDLSNASKIHWKNYQSAATELVLNLLPGDPKYAGYLISYSNEAELQANTTSDAEPLISKLNKLKPGGGSALFDAIHMACTNRKLVKGEPFEPRRVLVIIGDGHDSASKKTLNEVLEVAQRNLVTIYAISTVAYGFANENEKNLVRLCEETGGRVVYPLQGVYKDVSGFLSQPSDEGNYAMKVGTGGYAGAVAQSMFRAVSDVVGEVTTQYILRYTPTGDSAKAFRNVDVVVNLPNVKVRARRGYYAKAP